ncbi:alpha/beta fold hydrolase [Clostridium sp. UBA1652]|uniref:alpha/beta fold hydrolase n=1 Tax=Clostridium sp. UBA1652 TaxID=1946348 RepID=UPI002579943D|nr:alpha/beta hydrolase [Clostridium sp. UBA1652]
MVIKEYGDKTFPKVVILHPMLADGVICMNLLKGLGNNYCYIAPDISSHGESKSKFISASNEAREFIKYLKENDYKEVDLIFGASMGAVVALYVINDGSINFKTIVLDGAPMYSNSYILYSLLKIAMIINQKKARKKPKLIIKKMEKYYGELGEVMAKSLIRISKESMINILWSCTHFKFMKYSVNLQKKMFFEFGDKDFYSKRARVIKRKYPHVNINIRKNYGHCEFLANNSREYSEMIKGYMKITK